MQDQCDRRYKAISGMVVLIWLNALFTIWLISDLDARSSARLKKIEASLSREVGR
jgi:hypothetical protein